MKMETMYNTNQIKGFSEFVKEIMIVKGIRQSGLIASSLLSKTTISRLCRNSNDKGSSYVPTLPIIMAISVGLRLSREEATKLLFCAFPEMELWGCFLDKQLTIHQINEILYDNGFTLLGNLIED